MACLAGHTQFKQLVWLTIPCLVVLHLVSVVVLLSAYPQERALTYIRRLQEQSGSTSSHSMSQLLGGLCGMALCGFALGTLNIASPGVYDLHGGCTDPMLKTTVAPVHATPLFQWLWVTLSSMFVICSFCMFDRLQQSRLSERSRSVQRCLLGFLLHVLPSKAAIHAWKTIYSATQPRCGWTSTTPHNKLALWRCASFGLLHLPLLAIASAPAFGFVLAQNVPAGSGVFLTIMGNPLVVAAVKAGLSSLFVPLSAKWLSRVKYGISDLAAHDPLVAMRVLKTQVRLLLSMRILSGATQVSTILMFELCTVVLAPMVSVFVIDGILNTSSSHLHTDSV